MRFDLICGDLFLTSERGCLDRDDGSIGKLSLSQFGLVSIGVSSMPVKI